MANTDINIHTHGEVRIEAFSPLNAMALTIEASGTTVTYFNMPPAIAWAMFDLMRDGRTRFHYGDEGFHRIGLDPQGAADLIRRAREATETPAVEQPAPEVAAEDEVVF